MNYFLQEQSMGFQKVITSQGEWGKKYVFDDLMASLYFNHKNVRCSVYILFLYCDSHTHLLTRFLQFISKCQTPHCGINNWYFRCYWNRWSCTCSTVLGNTKGPLLMESIRPRWWMSSRLSIQCAASPMELTVFIHHLLLSLEKSQHLISR